MPGIGDIRINLSADVAKFVTTLGKADAALGKFGAKVGASLKAVGGAVGQIAGAFVSLPALLAGAAAAIGASKLALSFDEAADKVDKLGKASARLGVGVEQLSILRFAAGEAGVDFENLAKLVGKAGRSVAELVAGHETTLRLGQLNVELTDTHGEVRAIGDLLPDIARGLETAGSQAEQLRLAEKIFGRGGGEEFVQLLKESGGFIANLGIQAERARRLGVVFTDEQVEVLTRYRDAVGRISDAWLGFRVQVIEKFAPILADWFNQTASWIAAFGRIAGNISKILVKALDPGETGDAPRQSLARLFDQFTSTIATAGRGLMNVFVGVIKDGFQQMPALLKIAAENMAVNVFITPVVEKIAGFLESIDKVFFNTVFTEAGRGLRSALFQLQVQMEADIDKAGTQLGAGSYTLKAVDAATDNLAGSFRILKGTIDDTFGVAQAFAESSVVGLEELGHALKQNVQAPLTELERNWRDFIAEGQQAIRGFAQSASDAWAELAIDGKTNFDQLLKSWEKTLFSMAAKKFILQPLFDAFSTAFGTLGASFAGSGASAGGGVETAGTIYPGAHGFALDRDVARFGRGGVVMGPTSFPLRTGLIGEAGRPEGYFPLTRIGGDLAVRGSQTPVTVQVFDQRKGGEPVETREATGPDGQRIIQVMIRDGVRTMLADGSFDRHMSTNYGLSRKGARRG